MEKNCQILQKIPVTAENQHWKLREVVVRQLHLNKPLIMLVQELISAK